MAGDLGPRSILCSQDLLFVMVFQAYLPSTSIFNL